MVLDFGSNLFGNNVIEERGEGVVVISGMDFVINTERGDSLEDLKYDTMKAKVVTANVVLMATIHLPNKAVIIEAKVKGNAAAATKNWYLIKVNKSTGASTTITTATAINTEKKTDEIIDNSTYYYHFFIGEFELEVNDEIHWAHIKYSYNVGRGSVTGRGGIGGGSA